MARKKTSIIIDEDLWRELRKHCIDKNMDASEFLEQVIRKELKKK